MSLNTKAALWSASWVALLLGFLFVYGHARADTTKWMLVAVIKADPDPPNAVLYGHKPFDSQKECDDFRTTDATYLAANAKLEAKAKELNIAAEFKYLCVPMKSKGDDI